MAQNALEGNAPVVTVFPDDNKKYLSTGLFCEEPMKEQYVSRDIRLLGFRAHKRVCYTCYDDE